MTDTRHHPLTSAIGSAIRCNRLGAAPKITEYGGALVPWWRGEWGDAAYMRADLSQCCRSTAMGCLDVESFQRGVEPDSG